MNNVYYVGSGELTFDLIERIINENLKLELAPEAKLRIQKCRDYLGQEDCGVGRTLCMALLPVSVRCAVKTYRPMNSTPCKRIL